MREKWDKSSASKTYRNPDKTSLSQQGEGPRKKVAGPRLRTERLCFSDRMEDVATGQGDASTRSTEGGVGEKVIGAEPDQESRRNQVFD